MFIKFLSFDQFCHFFGETNIQKLLKYGYMGSKTKCLGEKKHWYIRKINWRSNFEGLQNGFSVNWLPWMNFSGYFITLYKKMKINSSKIST